MQSDQTNTPAAQNAPSCQSDYKRADVEKWFTRRAPTEGQKNCYQGIHDEGRKFALYLMDTLPPGRSRDLALDRLQEVIHWGETSIARDAD